MNLPNKLTLLRILLIPVFLVFVSFEGIPYRYFWAGLVFAFASFTDYLDGAIARKQGLVTDFGKFADPLADKILTTTAFLYMMLDGVCHPLVLVMVLTREFAVSGARMLAAGAKEPKVIAANIWGKAKTLLQMLSIVFYYAVVGFAQLAGAGAPMWLLPVTQVLCWLVGVLTLVSGVHYIWNSREYINTMQ